MVWPTAPGRTRRNLACTKPRHSRIVRQYDPPVWSNNKYGLVESIEYCLVVEFGHEAVFLKRNAYDGSMP